MASCQPAHKMRTKLSDDEILLLKFLNIIFSTELASEVFALN